MVDVVVRAIDAQEYRSVRASAGWDSPALPVCVAALQASLLSVVAEEDGRTVGIARVVGDGIYALVVDVVVIPQAQRRGIGTQLIGVVTSWARAQRVPHLALGATAEVSQFYRALGFGASGEYMRLVVD